MSVQTFKAPFAVDGLSAAKGAYGLVIRLPRPLRTRVGALGHVELPSGEYLYLGSAYGPGGLRARLGRHLRTSKPVHWHVDHLTSAGMIDEIVTVAGGRECDLVDQAMRSAGVSVPVAGFGSSDCRRCPSHLLATSSAVQTVLSTLADLLDR